MKVLQLLEMIDVPEDFYTCSICGKFHAPSDYITDGQQRTNCYSCYSLPYEDMIALKKETQEFYKTPEYKRTANKINKEISLRHSVITKEELINIALCYVEKLRALPNDALFVNYIKDDENGSYFETPSIGHNFMRVDCDYPYNYPKEIDGKKIYYTIN